MNAGTMDYGTRNDGTRNDGRAQAQHLNESQIDDVLLGDADVLASAHLAGCPACQGRVAEAKAPMANFAAVSLAWGERQSATLPLRPVAMSPAGWHGRAPLTAAALLALAVGIAIPVVRHEVRGPETAARKPAVAEANTEVAAVTVPPMPLGVSAGNTPAEPANQRDEEIARDNQMLAAIDRELNAPAETFGLPVATESTARVRPATLGN